MAQDGANHTARVMTWNVQGARRPDLRGWARAIADQDPDIVALQEVRRGQAGVVADLLDMPESRWLLKHSPLGRLGGRWAEGIAVLSRFPVRGYATALLSRDEPLWTYRRRVLQDVVVTTAGGPLRVVNTHLASHDDTARADQAERAALLLGVPTAGVGLDRTLLMGDLNTVDAEDVIGRFAELGLRDAWTDRHPGAGSGGHTNPTDRPHQRLDHVLVAEGFVVTDVRVPVTDPDWVALSDHLPVVADLALPPT